ncbi:cytoplasmic polyadenylation element-binding protein 2 isoform X2 [Neocloeon triangulifer]|uniref:cytoplasmic polyadenylation element-binding protein 2 isoform X2 n=1 Tax=Neocloeon triangulifer TaxID=2078957 RepID=UPI00286EC982|nr:cytoplasmic polyadenylation element-binding protein 2 isoform X2 [Neocloeon triangulifer]
MGDFKLSASAASTNGTISTSSTCGSSANSSASAAGDFYASYLAGSKMSPNPPMAEQLDGGKAAKEAAGLLGDVDEQAATNGDCKQEQTYHHHQVDGPSQQNNTPWSDDLLLNVHNGLPPAAAYFGGLQQQQQQQPRRPITAAFPMQAARHMTQPNMFLAAAAAAQTKPASVWSAASPPQGATPPHQPPPQSAWNSAGPPMGHNPWNARGRSVPNLNPMAAGPMANRKPSPTFNHQHQNMQVISPSKYRRSTSYPGKNTLYPPAGAYDIAALEDNRDTFAYQDRLPTTNGASPLDNMRSLEHYLNDLMRSQGTSNGEPHELKGFINCGTATLQSLAQLHGKSPFFTGLDESGGALLDDGGHGGLGGLGLGPHPGLVGEAGGPQGMPNSAQPLSSPSRSSPHSQGSETGERFSRKVFVGGLPPDIDEDEITASFRRFGPLVVDWPHKAESKSYFPPKGYAFLLFQDESSVQQLIDACIQDDDKLYLCVSSPTIKDKPVQIRPWRLSDADFVLDASMPLDPRKTVFVGGVPRPLKAVELAMIMDRLYGGVCYAGIDTDPELKYPKGAGRVAFSNQQSYIAAISARFVQLQHGDIDKRVEVKPYVLDDQMCDECQGQRCGGKFAPFFCANVTCLQYYCEHCWATIHSRPGREFHKPLVKEGADRPRAVPFRWC